MRAMPVADSSFGWQEAIGAFDHLGVAFLVTWVVTDLGHVEDPYVAILALTTLALAAGYLAWSGTSVADLVMAGWVWGIVGALVAAGVVCASSGVCLETSSRGSPPCGAALGGGRVRNAEAVLLATLPVLAIWQAADALAGRTRAAKVVSGHSRWRELL